MRVRRDIVVIGGSTGSTAVLKRVLADLPAAFPAALFVTTHMPARSTGLLGDILENASPLPVSRAVDRQPIEHGHVYVASPDRHLLLVDGVIRLGDGPQENMARPAVDPLFRSAALSFGPRVIGVVLTGLLNDGAAGLGTVKSCGGATVVQHPLDAEADGMPLAALEATAVDHVAPAGELGALLAQLVSETVEGAHDPSEELRLEVEIAAGARLGSDRLVRIAQPSALTCPDCQGVLSEVRGARPLRYRCQIGHAYTAESLAAQSDKVDEAIRVAMRVMEERVTLVERMAADAEAGGRRAVAELYEARAGEYRRYAATLREAAISLMALGRDRREQEL
jgi:two-component system, chemotaxis family, protein-glutamate methylesterase/glutaminase